MIQVIDPPRIEARGTPNDAVDVVTLGQQKLGEIRAVLAGYPRD
jgi:hypothetical protein